MAAVASEFNDKPREILNIRTKVFDTRECAELHLDFFESSYKNR
jgi:hypothetical protein